MSVIETEHLTKIYKRRHLGRSTLTRGVEDVSFSLAPGEIFGLLGLNGSGKTTTIKLLLGLLRPTSGRVSVLGRPMPSSASLSRIGYLPEVPYFYRYLTAAEILRFYGTLSNLDRLDERVNAILETVGLADWRNKRLADFSKGMLQRIGIAQSLLHEPDILIYDEPVSGLDPLAMREMRDLLLTLKEKGKTIFLSSHLISEVEKICDRAAILAAGRLVRVVEQKDWRGTEGELERIFIADVSGTSETGRIKIA